MTVTIADLCRRRMKEPSAKGFYTLKGLAESDLGKVIAPGKASDIIAHCRKRRAKVAPGTVQKDVLALRGLLAYAKPAWDMAHVTNAPVVEAMPILKKERLIGSSNRRTRIPTDAEREAMKAKWLSKPRKSKVPMPDIIDFQYYSTRRSVETIGLRRGDYNPDTQTILVRDMKHPTRKIGNHRRVALPTEAIEILMRQPRRSTDPAERFFPFNERTVQRLYRDLARECGFDDLTIHDSRRGGNTRLLKRGYPPQVVMLVTGHTKPDQTMTTYNGMKAEDFKDWRPS